MNKRNNSVLDNFVGIKIEPLENQNVITFGAANGHDDDEPLSKRRKTKSSRPTNLQEMKADIKAMKRSICKIESNIQKMFEMMRQVLNNVPKESNVEEEPESEVYEETIIKIEEPPGCPVGYENDLPVFPIDTEAELRDLNDTLKNEEFASYFVSFKKIFLTFSSLMN